MLFPNDSRCMTYDEKTQKSHTRSIPSEHKVLIIIELCRNRNSFHGSRTAMRRGRGRGGTPPYSATPRRQTTGFFLECCRYAMFVSLCSCMNTPPSSTITMKDIVSSNGYPDDKQIERMIAEYSQPLTEDERRKRQTLVEEGHIVGEPQRCKPCVAFLTLIVGCYAPRCRLQSRQCGLTTSANGI